MVDGFSPLCVVVYGRPELARSSGQSQDQKGIYCIPLAISSVLRLITKSMVTLKGSADIARPCFTPVMGSHAFAAFARG